MEPQTPATRRARQHLVELAAHGDVFSLTGQQRWQIGILGDDYRHSAVLVLFGVLDTASSTYPAHGDSPGADLDVLLVQRSAALRAHPGQVAFPGGRVDPHDGDEGELLRVTAGEANASHVRAAVREAHEETGLDTQGIEVLGTLHPVPVPVSNHLVTPVLGWWHSPSEVAVMDHAESSLVFRVPVLDLIDPARRYYATVTRGGRTYQSPAFDVPVHETGDTVTVWGFTGIMISSILEALEWSVPWDHGIKRPAPL